MRPATVAVLPRLVAAALLAVVAAAPVARSEDDVPLRATVERTDGTRETGTLQGIDREAVRFVVDGATRSVPVSEVRTITRAAAPAAGSGAVRVVATDGSTVVGGDLAWSARGAVIARGDERIEMPADRVRLAVWPLAIDTGDPEWVAGVPAEPQADLVVVSRDEGYELVECAIEAVAADTVTVVLDGERIPVKRTRVLGLVWVRPAADPVAGPRVAIDGGSLSAAAVEWSPNALVLDGSIRIPAPLLVSVDFAAGRTTSLVALETESVTLEPFFGGLAAIDGMSRFFAPRAVPAPSGDGRSLLVRPRSTAVWRVPVDSRRFRGTLVRSAAAKSAAAVRVTVKLDDRTAWAGTLDAATTETALDIDVAAARRLTIDADFVAGGMGCPVRFDGAVFEK